MADRLSPEYIVVVPEVEAFGGAERSVLALAAWLYGRGMPHRVVMYADHVGLAAQASFPLSIEVLGPVRGPFKKVMTLRRFLRHRDGPKPIMSGYQAALHASLGRISGFHTLMHDTPSLFSDHGEPKSIRQKVRRSVETLALRHGLTSGGATIVTSEYLKAEADRMYGCNATIVRMGGMAHAALFRPRRVGTSLKLLSVSRLEANKRIDWILRALGGVAPHIMQDIDWHLDIVGEGVIANELKALAVQLGLSRRVTLHGFVDDGVLGALFDQAHLFLMPARQGYGIPAIEALSRGIPVLLHRDSGVSDILRDTPWCIVADGDEAAFPPALKAAVRAVVAGLHIGAAVPAIPTEDAWAAGVAKACGWI